MIKKVFKVEKLFELKSIKKMLSKSDCIENGIYPVCSSDTSNNGIVGYYDNPEFIIDAENPVYITFGDHTRTLNIMQQSFSVIDNTKVLKPKIYNINALLYIITVWKKQIKDLGYARHWKIAKNCELNLPILLDKNNNPIFDCKKEYHSEGYIPDIEYMEERIRELEEERIRELTAYLKVSGLEDYKLTETEQESISKINNKQIEFKEFKIEDVLDWQPQKEIDPLKINLLTIENNIKYPFYGQATINHGVISYESLKETVLNNKAGKPTILVHSNNQNCIYLETPFYLKDGHGATSVLQNDNLNELNAHYIITCISKVITKKFNYDNKATKIALKNTKISLPVNKNNQIDYAFMKTYIKAIEKLVIKNVVDWRNKQISAAKQIVNTK